MSRKNLIIGNSSFVKKVLNSFTVSSRALLEKTRVWSLSDFANFASIPLGGKTAYGMVSTKDPNARVDHNKIPRKIEAAFLGQKLPFADKVLMAAIVKSEPGTNNIAVNFDATEKPTKIA